MFSYKWQSIKIPTSSFFQALQQSQNWDEFWRHLNLSNLATYLKGGIERNLNKFLHSTLFEVVMPSGLGLPMYYSLDFRAELLSKVQFHFPSENFIRSLYEKRGKIGEGLIDAR